MKKIIFGERIKKQVGEAFGPFTMGIEARGNMIFIAGQIALVNGKVIGKGDIAAQYKHIMENIKAILEDAGASMDDVVKWVNYVVPRVMKGSAEYESIVRVRKQYLKGDYPVSTMVQVAGLMHDDVLIEVDAIAVKE
jgi:2-iminobutanoate/2-iminopropanoate deaminase